MRLTFCEIGKEVEVAGLCPSCAERRRLEDLGFVMGERIIPMRDSGGALVVAVKNSRIALNKALAQKILVK